MKLTKFEVLAKDEIQQIHNLTLELLETIGVKVQTNEARELLKEHGAVINEDNFVKFPEDLVREKLKLVPDKFSLWF